jgi:hypothetical protein
LNIKIKSYERNRNLKNRKEKIAEQKNRKGPRGQNPAQYHNQPVAQQTISEPVPLPLSFSH